MMTKISYRGAVSGEEPKLTRALPPQDRHLMSQGDELEPQ